ncbi:helix-turn-helix transcriptional regulator [Paenibacillus humicola]|uniref:helix-turn-helix transcriptional regulator n=1 Tax=Paenibacillus humicola TaxID=3110540 RepID=UPI00237AC223|nr:helix-turn-helix transcriptional regulator [Paenibacillus humicola]
MSTESGRLKVLGDFLKSRRERLQPEQAGISGSYGRRRTPGLRREEVAVLAGVSVTYYTWLEQGREVTASREVMESIGRALQLSPDERLHLLRLWSPEKSFAPHGPGSVKPEWQKIIDQLAYPAFIANDRTEVLAWNRAASAIIADFQPMSDRDRVLMNIFFTDPYYRNHISNWDDFARYSVAVFRSNYDRHSGDSWFGETAERLAEESAEFGSLWLLHDIQLKKASPFILNHPRAGLLSFEINSFVSLNGSTDPHCCIYTPIAGTPTEQRLKEFLEATGR